jgi:hypothetical protein
VPDDVAGRVVRVNDGNDSNVQRDVVVSVARVFPMRFYNTAIPKDIGGFDAPVVLTVNPGQFTEVDFVRLYKPPPNLMFVRVRTNTWNLGLVKQAVEWYSRLETAVVLTFMAYFVDEVPESCKADYVFRKRTTNAYWAITTEAWERVMAPYRRNRWVHSCGKVEGEAGIGPAGCRTCGNCLREYFAAMERMRRKA